MAGQKVSVPVYRKLRTEIVPDAHPWVADIFSNLNLFGEQIQAIFIAGTDIHLVQGQKFYTTFTTQPDYVSNNNFTTIKFAYTGNGRPDCFLIGNISVADTNALITTSPVITSAFLSQNTSPPTVNINYISGLKNSTKYNITILVL